MKNIAKILGLITVLILAGCAHETPGKRPVQELFDEATVYATAGRIEKATDAFMLVRTYYPEHDLAKKALLKTADLYFDKEKYGSAIPDYNEFRTLYPTDPKAGYALYRIGMCHSRQIPSCDRDQTQTRLAIHTFKTFQRLYPNSVYMDDSIQTLTEARKVLARHDLAIGKFYLKNKNYEAACRRFQDIKKEYPGLGLDDEISRLIEQSCNRR